MTLEEKAEQFADNIGGLELTCSLLASKDKGQAYRLGRYEGYLAGAKENGVVWHDLRKDPNDLPKDCYDVLDEAGYRVFYHHKEGVWKNASGSKIVEVIAWCEIPQFKE